MAPADEAVHPRAVLAITLAGCSLFPAGGRGRGGVSPGSDRAERPWAKPTGACVHDRVRSAQAPHSYVQRWDVGRRGGFLQSESRHV